MWSVPKCPYCDKLAQVRGTVGGEAFEGLRGVAWRPILPAKKPPREAGE